MAQGPINQSLQDNWLWVSHILSFTVVLAP